MYNPAATERLLNIPEAIAREEGWNLDPPARCRRNHNPGNLNMGDWELAFGAVLETVPKGETARFAVFPNDDMGFLGLVHLCGFQRYKGKSLANLATAWAPPDENNTSLYLQHLCEFTGLTPDTIIDAHLAPVSQQQT